MTISPLPADDRATDAAVMPGDAAARQRAVDDRSRTIFVEAGAGSGKTTVLVERVVALVGAGTPIDAIAAITFTERSGAELRDRLRTRFEALATSDPATWQQPLHDLDRASIGTIHAFAQQILAEHALTAGLPATFDVLDEAASAVAFEQRWRRLATTLLASDDPDLAHALETALAAGAEANHLRQLARALDESWDLAESRITAASPMPHFAVRPIVDELRAAIAMRSLCVAHDDALACHLAGLEPLADELAACDEATAIARLVGRRFSVGNAGRKGNWRHDSKQAVVATLHALDVNVTAALDRQLSAALSLIAAEVATEVVHAARRRWRAGQLEFHDLLVGAHRLVVDGDGALRRALHERFRAVLIDEFQDTDPLQLALALALTADPDDREGAVASDGGGRRTPVPGRLFLVGDPKQSIYRFRRADLALYLDARRRLGPPLALTANFRSTAPVIAWINAVFAELVQAKPGSQARYQRLTAVRDDRPAGHAVVTFGSEHTDGALASEVRRREAADVARVVTSAVSHGWGVATPRDDGNRVEHRPITWRDIAVLIPTRTSLDDIERALESAGVPVRVESGNLLWTAPEIAELLALVHAACRPDDELAVVTALRTTLIGCSDRDLYAHAVERNRRFATGASATPGGGEGGWHAPVVSGEGDDCEVDGGVDGDGGGEGEGEGALGTPAVSGEGDGEGTSGASGEGDGLHDESESAARVASGLSRIRRWGEIATWADPARLLAAIVADTNAEAAAALARRPRESLRRIRLAQEQARAFADATSGTASEWLAWIERQRLDGARVVEPLLPEPDDDAVRILTIHAAKGLEFPMVVVAGLTSQPAGRTASLRVVWPPGDAPPEIKLGRHVTSVGFADAVDLESELDADERVRLLYVACTRARDHLAVSTHRIPWKPTSTRDPALGWLLASAKETARRSVELGPASLALLPPTAPITVDPGALELPALRAAPASSTVSATELAGHSLPSYGDPARSNRHASEDAADEASAFADSITRAGAPAGEPGDEPDPARRKAATELGTAVHWVLERAAVDPPAAGRGSLASLAGAAIGAAGAVDADAGEVARLAANALAAPIMRSIADGAEHWRELYVNVPGRHRQLEGFIDLAVRTPAGLVVVDFKTDTVAPPGDDPAPAHRLQLAAYAHALSAAAGEPVVGAIAIYCRDERRPQRELADLDAAIAEVVTRLDAPGA